MTHPLLDEILKPLRPYLISQQISEVVINKPFELWIEDAKGWQCVQEADLDMQRLKDIAQLTAAFTNQEVSERTPLLSARLPQGARIQIVSPPAVEEHDFGIAIRLAQSLDFTLDQLARQGVFAPSIHVKTEQQSELLSECFEQKNFSEFLKQAIKQKQNILISGGTGTGKTTFLNTLLKEIPNEERIITIEDVAELKVVQPNHLNLFTSRGGQSLAKLTATQLVEAALRLRPDRILMGELRGAEAFAYLRAINTGHPGALATIHADSPQLAIKQLILMVMQANMGLTLQQIEQYIRSVVDIIIQSRRLSNGQRVISQIYRLVG